MTEPMVLCLMLADGRGPMARRAIRSFRSQTYGNVYLLAWDTTRDGHALPDDEIYALGAQDRRITWWGGSRGTSIGAMRNEALRWAVSGPTPHPEIFAHWDSDDWSSPTRVAEQIALLRSSPSIECVGYREVVFWDERWAMRPSGENFEFRGVSVPYDKSQPTNEAWLYRSPDAAYAIGASLAYRRSAWERVPFPDLPKPGGTASEDRHFTSRVKCVGVSGIGGDGEPRLICSVHGSNTANYGWVGKHKRLRAAELDGVCRERMAL